MHAEKIRLAHTRFSDTAELKSCVLAIYDLEKALYLYRSTMDTQLTLLWNTRPTDQDMTDWKVALQHYHHASSQMEAKLKARKQNKKTVYIPPPPPSNPRIYFMIGFTRNRYASSRRLYLCGMLVAVHRPSDAAPVFTYLLQKLCAAYLLYVPADAV